PSSPSILPGFFIHSHFYQFIVYPCSLLYSRSCIYARIPIMSAEPKDLAWRIQYYWPDLCFPYPRAHYGYVTDRFLMQKYTLMCGGKNLELKWGVTRVSREEAMKRVANDGPKLEWLNRINYGIYAYDELSCTDREWTDQKLTGDDFVVTHDLDTAFQESCGLQPADVRAKFVALDRACEVEKGFRQQYPLVSTRVYIIFYPKLWNEEGWTDNRIGFTRSQSEMEKFIGTRFQSPRHPPWVAEHRDGVYWFYDLRNTFLSHQPCGTIVDEIWNGDSTAGGKDLLESSTGETRSNSDTVTNAYNANYIEEHIEMAGTSQDD
ncbi:hypothetical protein K491DRAFT_742171, partial [Lophiostoma macrostomum CBS 122681]